MACILYLLITFVFVSDIKGSLQWFSSVLPWIWRTTFSVTLSILILTVAVCVLVLVGEVEIAVLYFKSKGLVHPKDKKHTLTYLL